MSHQYRFLGHRLPGDREQWKIVGEEARHLKKVVRLKEGDQVEVFDGKGSYAEGLVEFRESNVFVRISSSGFEKSPGQKLVLGVGALKPGFVDDLLPSLTELGMQEIHIFLQEGVSKTRLQEKTRLRWEKILVSAAKQCKCNYLPEVSCWPSLSEFLGHLQGRFSRGFYLQPGATRDFLRELQETGQESGLCAVVGSEKGFSPDESRLLGDSFLLPVSLGPLVLRAYTATLSAGVLLSASRRCNP